MSGAFENRPGNVTPRPEMLHRSLRNQLRIVEKERETCLDEIQVIEPSPGLIPSGIKFGSRGLGQDQDGAGGMGGVILEELEMGLKGREPQIVMVIS